MKIKEGVGDTETSPKTYIGDSANAAKPGAGGK